jgi:hypothetical protein
MLDHKKTFCETQRFVDCHHFKKNHSLLGKEGLEFYLSHAFNRRRHKRKDSHFSVLLKKCTNQDNKPKVMELKAKTTDLSQGGVCVISGKKEQLPLDSFVTFIFGSDFIIPNFSGIGETRWESKQDSMGNYRIGLSFCEEKTKEILSNHLPHMAR